MSNHTHDILRALLGAMEAASRQLEHDIQRLAEREAAAEIEQDLAIETGPVEDAVSVPKAELEALTNIKDEAEKLMEVTAVPKSKPKKKAPAKPKPQPEPEEMPEEAVEEAAPPAATKDEARKALIVLSQRAGLTPVTDLMRQYTEGRRHHIDEVDEADYGAIIEACKAWREE